MIKKKNKTKQNKIIIIINNNNNGLLTDPLGGSSLLKYINYNKKINQIKLFTNFAIYN